MVLVAIAQQAFNNIGPSTDGPFEIAAVNHWRLISSNFASPTIRCHLLCDLSSTFCFKDRINLANGNYWEMFSLSFLLITAIFCSKDKSFRLLIRKNYDANEKLSF